MHYIAMFLLASIEQQLNGRKILRSNKFEEEKLGQHYPIVVMEIPSFVSGYWFANLKTQEL